MSDAEERTEQATEKRMKEVRGKGQLSRSQDVTAWLGVGGAAVMIPATIAAGGQAATDQLFRVKSLVLNPNPGAAVQVMVDAFDSLVGTLTPMFVVVVSVVLLGAASQGGIHFKKFAGKYEQFNLVNGIKQTFGSQALWQGVKALVKTAVVGLVLTLVIQGLSPILLTAGGLPVSALLDAAAAGGGSLLQSAVIAGLVLAAADVFVVMRRNRKKTRMTKKEIKDEHKSSDGDPLIKSQRRARQFQMSRNRMIASVADADVVLVNPIHVAVALRYEPGKSAPRVVAKGAGHIATRIREQAVLDKVPIVADIPLARALHGACDIGQEIPFELYNAVARVLAFVAALTSRGGVSSGVHSMRQPAMSEPASAAPRTKPAVTEPALTEPALTEPALTAGGR